MVTKNLSYQNFIEQVVVKALDLSAERKPEKSVAGFCQIQGPTGIGKTSALYRRANEGAPAALEVIKSQGLQAIFVTHRWNILLELYTSLSQATDSTGQRFEASIVYGQDETVVSAVLQRALPHEKGRVPSELPNPHQALDELEAVGCFSHQKESKAALIKTFSLIRHLVLELESHELGHRQKSVAFVYAQQELSRSCAYVERLLLECLFNLEKNVKELKKTYGESHQLAIQAHQKIVDVRAHAWIRRIFPAIAWKDEQQHLLILTTQKLFNSFYDGEKKVRMSSTQLAGKVIFIDEFDYQADILQSLLAQAQHIQEPPEFLALLLQNGQHVLKRLQDVQTAPAPQLYQALKELVEALKRDLNTKGIDLQRSKALVVSASDREAGRPFQQKYLFRSDHLITSEPLALQQTEKGFEVGGVDQAKESSVDVGDFLRVMEKYIWQLSLLTTRFAHNEFEAYGYSVRLSRMLFDPANDYRPSHYSRTVPNLALFSLPQASLPELKALSHSNLLPNTQIHLRGLTTWLLKKDESELELDPERVQIKRALLSTSPEGLLVSLASRNLVFSLSATSYIERALGHFDVRWIESALRYIAQARDPVCIQSFLGDCFEARPKSWFSKPIPYVTNAADSQLQKQLIQSLVQAKARVRQTQLEAVVHNFDQAIEHHDFKEIEQHLSAEFFDVSDRGFTYTYRKKLLFKLLFVMRQAAQSIEHKGHLVFVNSIRYLRKWLRHVTAEMSRRSVEWLQVDETSLQYPEAMRGFEEVFVPLTIDGTPLWICLLNAEAQKKSGFAEAYQAAFETNRSVVVLTQVASATNGINLDYFVPSTKNQMDLSALYLIETTHFYFSTWSDEKAGGEEMAHAGFQLRNLEKLVRSAELSRKQQRQYIMPLMTNSEYRIQELNRLYKKASDYIKNVAADVQQQVGRIERAWSYVPKVTVHVCETLAVHLERYTQLPVCSHNRHWMSDLNNQLLDQLLITNQKKQSLMALLMTQVQNGQQAVEMIDQQLIPALGAVRAGKLALDEVQTLWHQLGRAVLQMDLAWRPEPNFLNWDVELKDWACFERPRESLETGEVWYDSVNWQFFSTYRAGLQRYQPQALYQVVQRQPAILDWFNRKGYRPTLEPFASTLEEQLALHPKVIQRILQGRLGEEAIRGLLDEAGFSTSLNAIHASVFERYDFEVLGANTFIDAKYWSSQSLDAADEAFEAWLESGKKAQLMPLEVVQTWQLLCQYQGPNVLFVVANLVTVEQDCELAGFSTQLEPRVPEEAAILFLSGCISRKTNKTTAGFKRLVRILEQRFEGKK